MCEEDSEDPFCRRSELSGLSVGGVEPRKRKPWKVQERAEALSRGRIQRKWEAQVEGSTGPSEMGAQERSREPMTPDEGRYPEGSLCRDSYVKFIVLLSKARGQFQRV